MEAVKFCRPLKSIRVTKKGRILTQELNCNNEDNNVDQIRENKLHILIHKVEGGKKFTELNGKCLCFYCQSALPLLVLAVFLMIIYY